MALSVPAFGGAGDVFVNDGSGGIVTFSPANSYLGDTYLMRGTLEGSRFVADGAFGSLERRPLHRHADRRHDG